MKISKKHENTPLDGKKCFELVRKNCPYRLGAGGRAFEPPRSDHYETRKPSRLAGSSRLDLKKRLLETRQ